MGTYVGVASYVMRWACGTWVLWFVLAALLPVKRDPTSAWTAALASLDYGILTVGVAFMIVLALGDRGGAVPAKHAGLYRPRAVRFTVTWSLALALLGVWLIWFDRTVFQGIDYSAGIASAREQWREAGEARQGTSSLASLAGNLMAPLLYVGLGHIHRHWERLGAGHRYLGGGIGLIALVAYAALGGGRTPLLLALGLVVSVGILRRGEGKGFVPGSRFTRLLGFVALCILLVYSGYVFQKRAEFSNLNLRTYTGSFVDHLGGQATSSFDLISLPGGALSDFGHLAVLMDLYLVHSLWTFQTILEAPNRPGQIMFSSLLRLLARAGFVGEGPAPWLYAGRFIPLPGALWYDFGFPGFLLGGLVHGMLLGVAIVLICRHRAEGLGLALVVAVLILTLFAPLLPAFEMIYFILMLVAFVFMHLATRLRFHQIHSL